MSGLQFSCFGRTDSDSGRPPNLSPSLSLLFLFFLFSWLISSLPPSSFNFEKCKIFLSSLLFGTKWQHIYSASPYKHIVHIPLLCKFSSQNMVNFWAKLEFCRHGKISVVGSRDQRLRSHEHGRGLMEKSRADR